MESSVARHLLEINSHFYLENARSFSATRWRLQPGVQKLADSLLAMKPAPRLLDLGCGNGRLASYLLKHGFSGEYLGMDSNAELLVDARRISSFTFLAADLAEPDWEVGLKDKPFNVILAFAVLHHLPGISLRISVLQKAREHLASQGGLFVHSEWQFKNSSRLASHILPWEKAGLQDHDVDDGDALLDWRAGGSSGLRYVHQFTENELADLASQSHFNIAETFYSDGREKNLSIYQVWEPTSP